MVQRHTIYHLKARIVDMKISGGQGRGSIIGLPRPLFLKNSIYHKEWVWQANKNATPHKFWIWEAHYQTFQMRYYTLWIWIQMRDLAIKHLKYWFRFSSILERTKNSTKTNNTSFERSISGLCKSWRLEGVAFLLACHTHFLWWIDFFRRRGRGKPMMLPRPCPPGKLLSTIRAFKWDIVCLCTIFAFPVNWVQISKS